MAWKILLTMRRASEGESPGAKSFDYSIVERELIKN